MLHVYTATQCWTCATTTQWVAHIRAISPDFPVELINIDDPRAKVPDWVIGTPTYAWYDHLVWLGNPAQAELTEWVKHMAQFNKLGSLQEVDIFQDLSAAEIQALGEKAPMREIASGAQIYAPDQPTEVLFILKAGRVRLYHLSPDGKALTTKILESGTIFGEMALMGQDLYGSYAEALTACTLCLMSRHDVQTLLLSDPRIAARIAEFLGRRLIDAERRMSDFAFKRVPERLASLLLEHAKDRRSWLARSAQLEVRYTHGELAEMTGTYRETVTKILNEFQQANLIQLHRGRIVVLDPLTLQSISSGQHTQG